MNWYECDCCGELFDLKLAEGEEIDPPYFCPECDDKLHSFPGFEITDDYDYLDYYSGDYL